jgi:predicted AlkP superfamily phosphohydrolase/phosphomutase
MTGDRERKTGSKLIILGLDGGSPDLIRAWADEGRLPHFARLLGESAWGELRSTDPPMTFPGWSSLLTGENPGRHGVYDFTHRRIGTYEIAVTNAADRRARTFWKILSDAGKRVASIGVPVTYPPEPVNGIMISGFDAPANDARIMYPPELYGELKDAVGGYIVSPDFARHVAKGRIDAAVSALLESVERKWATALHVLQKDQWDCLMIVFGETDAAIHYLWKYHDPESPHFDPQAAEGVPDPVLEIYRKVDQFVGQLLDDWTSDATLMLVSDHGVGGSSDKILHLNNWLESHGLLRFRTERIGGRLRKAQVRVLNLMKFWARTILPKRVIKRLRFKQDGVGLKLESHLRFSSVDWKNTRVYSEETPYYPSLWVNLRGRDPDGTVEPGEEYEHVRTEIIGLLRQWKDPETGLPVVKGAYRREEVYHGAYVDLAPDIVVDWNLDRGYSYLSRPSYASSGRKPIEKVTGKELRNSRFMINRSGSHRMMGVWAARGEGFKKNHRAADLRIWDVAPTVLYLSGLPIPAGMDGRVPTDCLTEEFLRSHPVVLQASDSGAEQEAAFAYSSEEAEKVSERLRSLGYLE